MAMDIDPHDVTVGEIMAPSLVITHENEDIREVLERMRHNWRSTCNIRADALDRLTSGGPEGRYHSHDFDMAVLDFCSGTGRSITARPGNLGPAQ